MSASLLGNCGCGCGQTHDLRYVCALAFSGWRDFIDPNYEWNCADTISGTLYLVNHWDVLNSNGHTKTHIQTVNKFTGAITTSETSTGEPPVFNNYDDAWDESMLPTSHDEAVRTTDTATQITIEYRWIWEGVVYDTVVMTWKRETPYTFSDFSALFDGLYNHLDMDEYKELCAVQNWQGVEVSYNSSGGIVVTGEVEIGPSYVVQTFKRIFLGWPAECILQGQKGVHVVGNGPTYLPIPEGETSDPNPQIYSITTQTGTYCVLGAPSCTAVNLGKGTVIDLEITTPGIISVLDARACT